MAFDDRDEIGTPGKPRTPPTRQLHWSNLLRGPFDIKSFALTGLFVLAVFYTMYFMRAIILPLVLALLLSYLLTPLVRGLAKARIRPPAGAAIILLTLIGLVVYGISRLAEPAAGWLEKAPYSLKELQQKLLPLKKPIEKVAQATGEIDKITTPEPETAKPQAVVVKRNVLAEAFFTQTPEFVASAVVMLILLYFLLASDGVFLAKIIKLNSRLEDKKRALSIMREIESQISRYLLTITAINIGLGLAVGTTVHFLGLRNPIMWGVLVALLNFVPYLGALTGIICMTLGAVLSFDSLGYAMVFPASYLLLATLEGNFITPMVLGRSLTLNPVIILIALTFWGWMWGISGMILAVPILATFKIFCDHIEPMAPIGEFMS
ncbi:MAG: AI-2E family transporter [Chthoniobacterales bacterium]|nr:MAG: AI-2E family transporter [Chthoniobacterales bacterium]